MKNIGNKGFTLVELIATIVVLSLIMGIASYSITSLINDAQEREYGLLVKELKVAVETYYQECKYANNDSIECPVFQKTDADDGYYEIIIQDLLDYGFIKGNATGEKNDWLLNPITNTSIGGCKLRYNYVDGEISFFDNSINTNDSCPDLSS